MKEIDYLNYLCCVRRHFYDIVEIKEALANDNYVDAAGIWYEMPEIDQTTLFCLAPTKGGIFTTEERTKIKLPEFNQAYFGSQEDKMW